MPPLVATDRLDLFILNVAYLVWLLPEVVTSFTRKIASNAKVNDRFSGLLLMACIWLGVFLGNISGYAERGFAISWDRPLLFDVGIFLMLAGVAFRWYSIRVLGKYFTTRVAIRPGQSVIENGPYRWIRHPSYSGTMLTMFGAGLALTNWLSLLSIMAFAIVGYSYRIWVEEVTLVNALGEPYRVYMRRTKRIIPFII